ncbi:hypothetical protein [Natronococcus sp. A-GB7]|uniref:hypothetical protein n=1 Tax=Natronococcus sp. A-GB7 TaxID=3037649 RepID=UPI00241DDED0|nr:hypothetical protein [Natronococcus sp. A-GB7]MDG5821844.1 hypothetical protein [Natronococcus sp. A-GB7]
MKRSLENRLEALEGGGNAGGDGLQVTIKRHRVDEDGERAGVVKETRCGFDRNGEWYSETVE